MLAAYTDIEQCIQCLDRNQEKHVFLIASGAMGRTAVLRILERFPNVFTDLEMEKPYASIYVYCHNVEYQMDWALDYRDYIEIFNHDADLLVRMIRDIADYFVMKGKRLFEEDLHNNTAAYHRFSWAHVLYQRYSKMQSDPLRREFDEVNRLLAETEEEREVSEEED